MLDILLPKVVKSFTLAPKDVDPSSQSRKNKAVNRRSIQ